MAHHIWDIPFGYGIRPPFKIKNNIYMFSILEEYKHFFLLKRPVSMFSWCELFETEQWFYVSHGWQHGDTVHS